MKKKHGGARPGAGRPKSRTSVTIDLTTLPPNLAGGSYNLNVEFCSCGAIGWDDYEVRCWGRERDTPDADGNYFPILAVIPMAGRKIQHKVNCPERDK